MYKLIVLGFLICLTACQSSPSTKENTPKPFFDLKSYFTAQIAQLAKQKGFKKATYVNGIKEERQVTSLNFEKELHAFKNADLNKISWFDKYTIDSVLNDQVLTGIRYQAKDTTLSIQQVSISFANNEVETITIHKKMKTLLAAAKQILRYAPKSGYSIENEQSTKMGSEQHLKVEVLFEG